MMRSPLFPCGRAACFLTLLAGLLASAPTARAQSSVVQGPRPAHGLAAAAADLSPVVTAPPTARVHAGSLVMFDIAAGDPDGDAIASLVSTGAEGSNFVRSLDNRWGRLSWTPRVEDIGFHTVTFTASNALAGSATTTIEVLAPSAPPIPSLIVTPTSGNGPLAVRLDASGSTDPDGSIVLYKFDFGDGGSADQSSPVVEHTYAAGRYQPSVTVYDDAGIARKGFSATIVDVNAPPVAALSFQPNGGGDRQWFVLSGWASTDDGGIVSYHFDFGDGTSITTPSREVQHWYPVGDWVVSLTVTDDKGLSSSVSKVLTSLPDRPPTVIGAPDTLIVKAPSAVNLRVRGWDPDGGAVGSVTGTGPPGSNWWQIHYDEGQLNWFATRADTGVHTATFTASNRISSTKQTTIIVKSNQLPVTACEPVAVEGVEPLTVRFDASRSFDPDGKVLRYRFEFGDGVVWEQTNPVATHVYLAGQMTATVWAFDDNSEATAVSIPLNVAAVLPNLATNSSFESDLKGWGSYGGSTLERVPGGKDGGFAVQVTGPADPSETFGLNDSPDFVRRTGSAGTTYRYIAWVRSPSSRGYVRLRIREYLVDGGQKVGDWASEGVWLSPDWQQLIVEYTVVSPRSTLDFQIRNYPIVASEAFVADAIQVKYLGGPLPTVDVAENRADGPALEPSLRPSPIRSSGSLAFRTSVPGPLRVDVLDLAGRRIRRLLEERDAPAGPWEIAIGTKGDGRFQAGVYFYRIEAAEGSRTGRFVVLP